MMREFGNQIYEAVRRGRLKEPFTSKTVQTACPNWASATYSTFLAKHAEGNPGRNSALFVRAAPGCYRLKNSN
jgi:hypothetical protein